MATIALVEPGPTGGPGAMGAIILRDALAALGHRVDHLRVSRKAADAEQGDLFGGIALAHSGESARQYDAVFVSMIYVRQWVHLPAALRALELEPLSRDRRDSDPLVAFGGQVMISPSPIAPFADVVAMGDGEVTGARIASLIDSGMGRRAIMEALAGQPGFWVPSLDADGARSAFSRAEAPAIAPRILHTGHSDNRAKVIEVARGCASKCAFCPIGWAGGTYRELPLAQVDSLIRSVAGSRVNLFAPDYSSVSHAMDIDRAASESACVHAGRDARLDRTNKHLAAGGTAKSYNFGIEGFSERLRRAIGKPLAADAIVDSMARLQAEDNVREVKFYLINALPGQGAQDAQDLMATLDRVRAVYHKRLALTVTHLQSVPHTPLQWCANHYSEAANAEAMALRDWFRELHDTEGLHWLTNMPKGRETHEHDAVLQRLDERAAGYLIELGGREGRIQDGRWRDIAACNGIDPGEVLGEIEVGAPTPWSHVDTGVPRDLAARTWGAYKRKMGIVGFTGAEEVLAPCG